MDYDLDNCPRSAHALRNRISSSGNAGRDLSIQTDAVIKVDVDNDDVEKYRRLVGILDLESGANVARRVSSREAAANQVQIYNANGNQVATTQIDNHILWNTRRRDEVTGYYMYKFRHYSPELGRWLARDPIEEKGGINLYGVVGNQPTWYWDRLGLQGITGPGATPGSLGDHIDENIDNADTWSKPVGKDDPLFQAGAEAHLAIGVGGVIVDFCGKDNKTHELYFIKYCFGPAAGVALSGGPVFGIPQCSTPDEVKEMYQGWFLEGSFSIGPASVGFDLGLSADENNDTTLPNCSICNSTSVQAGFGPVILPSSNSVKPSGVNEAGVGGGAGLFIGVTACYYVFQFEVTGGPCCCEDE